MRHVGRRKRWIVSSAPIPRRGCGSTAVGGGRRGAPIVEPGSLDGLPFDQAGGVLATAALWFVERGDWQHDPAQQDALRELDRLGLLGEVVAAGAGANQEVPHLHVHIFGGQPLGPMLSR